jgi:predicted metal-dependent phosphoesterase TrpH
MVRLAYSRGVEVLAVTDHDSVCAFPEALEEASKLKLRIACGVEINTCEDDQVHILGYGIDWRCKKLAQRLEFFRRRRQLRIERVLERLKALGIDIGLEDVQGVSKQTLGRPHIADALRRKRIVHSRQEAFQKYLSKGTPGYVDPMGPSVQEAIETIREAGGWACLAHPGLMHSEENIKRWVDFGLEGVEAYYLAHTRATVEKLLHLASSYGLIPTGGSDYHGPGTGREKIGGIEVPEEVFSRLESRLAIALEA